MSRASKRAASAAAETDRDEAQSATSSVEVLAPDVERTFAVDGLPARVKDALAEAGERAALRLAEMLRPGQWETYKPHEQRALLDLALTRAYGRPVNRTVNVNLSTSDADAVAASLSRLSASLPRRKGAQEPSEGDDSGET